MFEWPKFLRCQIKKKLNPKYIEEKEKKDKNENER